ncbi:MAG: efflux RND transporter periplasmic adaptor subunit [Myxococcota bacterium]|nr:efflux RND transporter periplasmic adaptor subunit [Myxococcota bacterium]
MRLILLLTLSCSEAPPPLEFDSRPRLVVTKSQPIESNLRRRYTATVEANRDIQISAEVGGILKTKHVEVGSIVAQQGKLLTIAHQDALAQTELSQAQFDEAKLREEEADLNWKRIQSLKENLSVAEVDSDSIALRRSKAAVEGAKAQRTLSQNHLQRHFISAPFAGQVTDIQAEEGALLRPGQPLLRLIDTSTYKVTLSVQEQLLSSLEHAQFELAGATIVSHTISPTPRSNRTWEIEISFAQDAPVFIGSFVDIQMTLPPPKATSKIPLSALFAANHIWLVSDDQTLEKKRVDIVHEEDDAIYVRSLPTDATLVLYPNATLRQQQSIVPVLEP